MVQITPSATLRESTTDVVQEGLERARETLDTVTTQAIGVIDPIDVDGLKSIGRGLIANLHAREPDCTTPVEAARDDERLKSAAIAGAVIFIVSLIVFLLAREVARRQATQRRPQQALRSPESATNEG